jgi:N-acetylmuramic acid 6-phosphate etherase
MNLDRLQTEQRNPDSQNIDILSTYDIVSVIQREDEKVSVAVRIALPEIATAVEMIVEALFGGGRLFYIGAGTSGRLGVLDAAECPPTFDTAPELVQAVLAGGNEAIFHAVEGAEDDPKLAETDLKNKSLAASDILVGLAASGRTPYVIGALQYAERIGCRTIAVVCSSESEMSRIAGLTICVPVGPEVITGSTRMKAGTAQKMVLNMLSTASMIKMGKTYGNLMVDVRASNAKLMARIQRIVQDATGAEASEVAATLQQAAGSAKIAIVMLLAGVSAETAGACIEESNGVVRQALLIARQKLEMLK